MFSNRFLQPCKVVNSDREVDEISDREQAILELDVAAVRAIRILLQAAQ